ncbi:MAG: DNA-binding response regulator, partial [Azospira oryzae]
MSDHRILLVDDDLLSLKLLKAIFDTEGYTTYTATDGREALSILQRESIALVITDILMPNIDGYYLCYKIR